MKALELELKKINREKFKLKSQLKKSKDESKELDFQYRELKSLINKATVHSIYSIERQATYEINEA